MPDSGPAATAVTIRLVYLARLRGAFGCAGEALTPDRRAGWPMSSAGCARSDAGPRNFHWRAVRVAVNHALAPADTELRDGDEVALLPPVTGG
jgi:molybdopterin synthase sulfur carrier subunit